MSSHSVQQNAMARDDNPAHPGPMLDLKGEASSAALLPFGPRVQVNLVRMLNSVVEDVRSRADHVGFAWDDSHSNQAAKVVRRMLRNGDNEKRFITIKLLSYIQSHKTVQAQNEEENELHTKKHQKEKARRLQGELLAFFLSLTAEIKSLRGSPSEPAFNFSDLENEVNRVRHLVRKVSAPFHLTHRTQERPTGDLYHVNSLAISLNKPFLLSLALVTDPDDSPGGQGPGKTASPHIFRLTWPKVESKPLTTSSQSTPGSISAAVQPVSTLHPADAVYIKQEPGHDTDGSGRAVVANSSPGHGNERMPNANQQLTRMVGDTMMLPRIVVEIGHLAIVHTTTTEHRHEVPITATGLGLFVDSEDVNKGLWLLRTDNYIGVRLDDQPSLESGLIAFLKKRKLYENCGNAKLSRSISDWFESFTGEQQIHVLQHTGSIKADRRRLVPKFETFAVSYA